MLLAPLAPAADAPEPLVPLWGTIPAYVDDASDQGATDETTNLSLRFMLRVDIDGLLAKSRAGFPLTIEERNAAMPTRSEVRDVEAWLTRIGLSPVEIYDDLSVLRVETNVAAASRALQIEFHDFDVSGKVHFSPATPPLVPLRVQGLLQTIVGLSDGHFQARGTGIGLPGSPVNLAGSGTHANRPPPFVPVDIRDAYDVSFLNEKGLRGFGANASIITWGPVNPGALLEYSSEYGLPPITVAEHIPHGLPAEQTRCPGSHDLEWDLDAQMIHAVAPDAAIHVYCANSATLGSVYDMVWRTVYDNVTDVISQSFGACEPLIPAGTMDAYEIRYALGATQGQTFFASSGNSGSRGCSPWGDHSSLATSFPATSPHVTSVGGTSLILTAGGEASETVWNTCTPCANGEYVASGGGNSSHFGKPSWQLTPGSRRTIPDISAVADPQTGVRVRHGGSWWTVGGTSVSSPIHAGMWAIMNGPLGRQGNAAEFLWAQHANTAVLRDVTQGSIGDFAAGPGYDSATGHGSLRLTPLFMLQTGQLPVKPTRLVATSTPTGIRLSWSYVDIGEPLAIKVFRGASPESLALVEELGIGTHYVDTSLQESAYYAISVVNRTGESPRSPVAMGLDARRSPGPPTAVEGAPTGFGGEVELAWVPPQGVITAGYRIYRSMTSYWTADPLGSTRLLGTERMAFPLDADDADVPAPGRTRDAAANTYAARTNAPRTSGRFDEGILFQGAGSALSIATVGPSEQGTLMFWIKPGAFESEQGRVLFKQLPGRLNDMSIFLDAQSHGIALQTCQCAPWLRGSIPLPLGEWSHVAVQWGPQGKRIHINGEVDVSDQDASGVGTAHTITMVGNDPSAMNSGGLKATLDEIREYHVVLDSTQITDIASQPYWQERLGDLLTTVNTTTFVDAELEDATGVYYRVAALGVSGEGPGSHPVGLATPGASSMAPRNVRAEPAGAGEVRVSWLQPSIGMPTAYRVRSCDGPGAPVLATTTAQSFLDTEVPVGVKRCYNVTAIWESESDPTPSAVSFPGGPPVGKVQGLTAKPGPSPGDVSLSWFRLHSVHSTPHTAYRIERATPGGEFAFIAETEGETYLDPGQTAGVTNLYRITSINPFGQGPASDAVAGMPYGVPGLPQTYGVARRPGELSLQWGPPEQGNELALLYSVYTIDPEGAAHFAVTTQQTELVVPGVLPNTTYRFAISARNQIGESERTPSISSRTYRAPTTPLNVSVVVPALQGTLLLNWTAPSDTEGLPIIGYNVYAADAGGDFALLARVSSQAFNETGLSEGQSRVYSVAGITGAGEGNWSANVTAAALSRPSAPRALRASLAATGTTVISWNAPLQAPHLIRYNLYRTIDSSQTELIAHIAAPSLSYRDSTCLAADACEYFVTASNIVGEGPASNVISSTGASPSVRSRGEPSASVSKDARWIGHERLIYQFDNDDQSATGRQTMDRSPFHIPAAYSDVFFAEGRFGRAFNFSSGGVVSVPGAATSALVEGTIMVWAKPDSLTQGRLTLMSTSNGGGQRELLLQGSPNGSILFSTPNSPNPPLITPSGLLQANQWTHIAVTWGPQGRCLYVNGELAAVRSGAGTVGSISTSALIGADSVPSTTTSFRGKLDEFRLYDVALGIGEIQRIAALPYADLLPSS